MGRFALVLPALAALALAGCSGFWDRSPRVAGSVQQGGLQQGGGQPERGALHAAPPAVAWAPAAPGGGCTTEDLAVLEAVNRIRTSRRLPSLRHHPALWIAAQGHSLEQARHGYMGHGSPDPARRTLAQRMRLAGYAGSVYAEVVAWGYRDVQAVVEGWMHSREHRDILVDPELTEAAFSRVGAYWTGNFGAPGRQGPPRASVPVAPVPGHRGPQAAPGHAAPPRHLRPDLPPPRVVGNAPPPPAMQAPSAPPPVYVAPAPPRPTIQAPPIRRPRIPIPSG